MEGAERAYRKSIQHASKKAEVYNALALLVAEDPSRGSEALSLVGQAVRLYPSAAHLATLGWIHAIAGNHEEAQRVLDQAFL